MTPGCLDVAVDDRCFAVFRAEVVRFAQSLFNTSQANATRLRAVFFDPNHNPADKTEVSYPDLCSFDDPPTGCELRGRVDATVQLVPGQPTLLLC